MSYTLFSGVAILETAMGITSRSPRLSNGYPRILLVLVLEVDSHRGVIILYLQKCKTRMNC